MQSLSVSEAQDLLPMTVRDLQRVVRRLRRQYKKLGVTEDEVCAYYDSWRKAPPTLEVAVSEEIDMAAGQLEDLASDLEKASRLTEDLVRQEWREWREEQRWVRRP